MVAEKDKRERVDKKSRRIVKNRYIFYTVSLFHVNMWLYIIIFTSIFCTTDVKQVFKLLKKRCPDYRVYKMRLLYHKLLADCSESIDKSLAEINNISCLNNTNTDVNDDTIVNSDVAVQELVSNQTIREHHSPGKVILKNNIYNMKIWTLFFFPWKKFFSRERVFFYPS